MKDTVLKCLIYINEQSIMAWRKKGEKTRRGKKNDKAVIKF